jgi:CBS domain-containing protein
MYAYVTLSKTTPWSANRPTTFTALQTMRKGKIRRLPVVDDDALLEGIVSMDDVVVNAEPDGKMGSVISYGDVVTALQAIYLRGDQFGGRSVAA